MARDESDDIQAFEAKETSRNLPWGWLALFWGLILWGVYYAWSYTPPRWSQQAAFDQAAEAAAGTVATSGTNIAATIFFTAAATTAAVILLLRAGRKRAPKAG